MSALSTKHAVLGLMVDEPSYGYRLQREVADRLGFLRLADSATYKILGRLEEDGLVEEAGELVDNQTRRGPRRVLYRATREGRLEFQRWMASPSDRGVLRDELQAKLAVSRTSDIPLLLQVAEDHARECMAELARLTRRPTSWEDTRTEPWSGVATRLAEEFNALWLEMIVDWLGAVTHVLQDRLATGNEDPSRRES